MKRFIDYNLNEWKHSKNRKSLLVRGARQVGKTYAIRNFGKSFESFAEFNLEKMQNELTAVFEKDLSPIKIIKELSIISGHTITPGKTLLFFDEIQAIPRAILALRYFYEEMPDLHVVAAGSLLDFAIEEVGLPVGRVQSLYMYPLSFLEFLSAVNNMIAIEEIINHDPSVPMSEAIHNKLLSLLGEYLATGGLPEAIKLWVDGLYLESFEVHRTIIDAYKQDFNKYAKKHQINYLNTLFRNIPTQIGTKFKFSTIGEYRKRELMPALELLETSRVINLVNRTSGSGLPLGAGMAQSDFKIILIDVAINQVLLGEKKDETPRDVLGSWHLNPIEQFVNKGNLIEAFVGQEILAYSNPNFEEKLYYWRRETKGSEAEIDYLIQINNNVIPIEVKSGKGSTLKSMNLFLTAHTNSPYGIRFSIQNYSIFEKIHSYPLYAVAAIALHDKNVIQALL